jgi:hypothetical protein
MSDRFGHLLVRGKLREFGYSVYLPEKERQKALDKAVKEYGGLSVYRKLIAVYTLNKNRAPEIARRFRKDANYIKNKYYNTKFWEPKMVISQRAREKLRKAGLLTAKGIKAIKKALRLDPEPKKRKRTKKEEEKEEGKPVEVKMRIRNDYLRHTDFKADGLLRIVEFKEKPRLVPEFAIYIPVDKKLTRLQKEGVKLIEDTLKEAKFKKEAEGKWVLRTKRYNIFVYFI